MRIIQSKGTHQFPWGRPCQWLAGAFVTLKSTIFQASKRRFYAQENVWFCIEKVEGIGAHAQKCDPSHSNAKFHKVQRIMIQIIAFCIRNDESCTENDEFCIKTMNLALKMMNSALKLTNLALKMMNSALKLMNCVFKAWAVAARAEADYLSETSVHGLRNHDFLSKSHDFLLKDHDFLSKHHDFLSKNHDFLLKQIFVL